MRQLAPEVLLTAKTQRWAPDEVLHTLIEAEIASRDASNTRARLKAAAFPGHQDHRGVRPGRLEHPGAHLGLPHVPGMD